MLNYFFVDEWLMNPGSNYLITFFVFMFLWTSSLFQNLEKITIAGVVGEWYFQPVEQQSIDKQDEAPLLEEKDEESDLLGSIIKATSSDSSSSTIKNLRMASTTSFGSVAFGSLILSLTQGLQFLVGFIRKYVLTKRTHGTPVSSFYMLIETGTSMLSRAVDTIHSYSLVYAGITGK